MDTTSTVQDETDADGRRAFTYLTSGFGGVDSLALRGSTALDTASATIALQRPGLVELMPGTNYQLIGKTDSHTENHFATARTIRILKMLADSAHVDSSWGLQYNDMSLINGGPFDYRANWDTPHQTHREGRNVDMRPRSDDGREVDAEWLERYVVKIFGGRLREESRGTSNHHFHLTF